MTIPGDRLQDQLDVTVSAPSYGSKRYDLTPNANPAVLVLERR
jgi:hypothetical protein